MIERRPFTSLLGSERDWLRAKHHFSFEDAKAGWGALRIWNDDEIAPESDFPLHRHENMEIITYVLEGAIDYRNSLGNQGRIEDGDGQATSAGTGIQHAELNLESRTAHLFQLWIVPSVTGGSPAWSTKPFPKQRAGGLAILASGLETDRDALPIRSAARVLGATLNGKQNVNYQTARNRFLYLVPAFGSVTVNGVQIDSRDGAAIADVSDLAILALQDSEIVLVDGPAVPSLV